MNKKDSSSDSSGDWEPQEGEVCMYRPPRFRKAIECEITAVYEDEKVANLSNNGRAFDDVPWSELSLG